MEVGPYLAQRKIHLLCAKPDLEKNGSKKVPQRSTIAPDAAEAGIALVVRVRASGGRRVRARSVRLAHNLELAVGLAAG